MSQERPEPTLESDLTGADDVWISLSLEVSQQLLTRTREVAESIKERVRRLVPEAAPDGT